MKIRQGLQLLFSAASAIALVGVAGTPAVAANRPTERETARAVVTSDRVGGYIVQGGSQAHGVFVVPTLECATEDAAMLLGVVGFSAKGALIGGAGVFASCVSGGPLYDLASQEFDGEVRPMHLPVRSGDAVEVNYSWDPLSGHLQVEVKDLNRPRSAFDMYREDAFGRVGTVELGASRLGAGQPVNMPAFGRTTVRSVSVDDHRLAGKGVSRTTLVDVHGNRLVRASAPNHDGRRFDLVTPGRPSSMYTVSD